ncbi:aromatic amino acid ammonia-lyase [Vulcanisaeta distributa]|uniref:aromatic amino acid ammonia-lyase n=1 Tax=Vulcanisaeta distributa TaxID=164451 RepID=UPI001FB3CFB5|nr:aromatic amino acid ammonia-lyase [Vulcanisaeta distributa]
MGGVSRNYDKVIVNSNALSAIDRSRRILEELIHGDVRIYGVNTGLGDLYNVTVNPEDVAKYSLEMLIDHSTGVGDYAPDDWVRATMLIRAHQLSLGYSGVRDIVVNRLVDFLNMRITPLVPRYGSVGASGDLAPLAHIALALLGRGGMVRYQGKIMSSAEALKLAGLDELRLSYKEALSLINGTSYSTAVASLGIWDTYRLLRAAIAVMALMIEVSRASTAPLGIEVNTTKLHKGELEVARVISELIIDSKNVNTSGRTQDPYSIRCIPPQVLGSVLDALNWALHNVLNEANSVSDNPIIINNSVYSTCHFHGQYIAFSTDLLNMSLAVLGNLIDRQIAQLLRKEINGVSNYLASGPWRVGLMLTQYTAAALSARLRELSTPSTVQNIPTSGFQEDVNSMSANSAIKLHEVNSLIAQLIAILAYDAYVVASANNACENCGKATAHIYGIISKYVAGTQSHSEAITRLMGAIDELSSLVSLRINPS